MAEPLLITDPDDPRLAPYRGLRQRNPTRREDYFIAEGRLVVERLLASCHATLSVLVEQGAHREIADQVPQQVPLWCLAAEPLRTLVGFDFHRGVLACGRRPPTTTLETFLADPQRTTAGGDTANVGEGSRRTDSTWVVCCGVSDPENLGSLLRTAAAFGIDTLVLCAGTADPYSRRVLRVSMAAALKLTLIDGGDPLAAVRLLAERGYRIVATTLAAGAMPLDQFQRRGEPLALLVGNEAQGLPQRVEAAATDRVTIPMRLGTDSLNVAVATGIILYELTKGEAHGCTRH